MAIRQSLLFLYSVCIGIAAQAQVFSGKNQPYKYETVKKMVVDKGAVVSAHPLASEAGLLILKMGGNAVDAAIATQLALAVVYPNAGNLGGGGFMVAMLADGKKVSLDYREMAPTKAHRDMYIDFNGVASTQKSQNGHLASGIPGTVAGLFEAHRHAKLPFSILIQPAIELAEKGFAISESEARSLNYLQSDLKKYNTVMPVFYRTQQWKGGDTLIQSDLAATLKRIQKNGRAGFYEGETARLVAAEMKRGNGLLTEKDMKTYLAKWRTPHEFDYKGYRIVGMPMPSSGGLLLHQMMKMVENRNLSTMGFQTPASVQLMTEVMRRAFADRSKYMGDADFYPVPVSKLTDPDYLTMRMNSYRPDAPTPSQQLEPGNVNFHESEETTHLSVMDAEGNAVAVTTTLNGSYGSKTVVGGAGFFLNNEMDDFSIKPGVPNMFGAIGGEANAIMPGKRMLSSMTPTLVLENNKPFIVIGTPGGTTIPTQIFQALINILEFGMDADDAINKPKFHHQWLPDELITEKGFMPGTTEALKKMGYSFGKERGGIGRTEIILVRPDGKKEAVADRRGEDGVAGF
ncbi:MAG: gamma-glutamyltransferase [Bacteroidota bacterium]